MVTPFDFSATVQWKLVDSCLIALSSNHMIHNLRSVFMQLTKKTNSKSLGIPANFEAPFIGLFEYVKQLTEYVNPHSEDPQTLITIFKLFSGRIATLLTF